MPAAAITRECLAMFRSEGRRYRVGDGVAGIPPVLRMENLRGEGGLEVELADEAGEPKLRLSAKHGFVEAAGLKTIGLDLALVADAAGVGDALVNAILALPRKG